MSLYGLYFFLIVVSVWDGITYRIPNAFILIGLGIGMFVSFYDGGWSGGMDSLFALGISSIIFFLIWAIAEVTKTKFMGAGDMKLFIVMASFIGVASTITIFYYSLIIASFLFLLITPPKKIANMFTSFLDFTFYALPSIKEKEMRKIAFSFPVLIALSAHIFLFS